MLAANPDLDPSLFYAALAYYHANRAQVEADLDEDARRGAELADQYVHGRPPKSPPA
jgi:hypothetical protein